MDFPKFPWTWNDAESLVDSHVRMVELKQRTRKFPSIAMAATDVRFASIC
jgi:hypothetical protein